MSAEWPHTTAVIGCGTMGGGFAQLLCLAGVRVQLADAQQERAVAGRLRAIESARKFAAAGMMPFDAPQVVEERLSVCSSITNAVMGVSLVLEAVTEDADVKHLVFQEVEAAVPEECIIATNTSAIPIRDLAARLRHPQRFLGAHWFNPPQWVPCVEVIPSAATDSEVVQRMHGLLHRLGKRPVTVGDSAGFVANRIQFAMFKEAVSCVDDGIATPEQVDQVVRSSFGFRLPFFGPFAIADMAGLDVYAGAYEALTASFGGRFAVPRSVAEHVAAGRLGAKTGGAYLEPDPRRSVRRDAAYFAMGSLLDDLEGRAPNDAR